MSDVFSTVQDSSTWTDIQGKASKSFGPLFPSMASISMWSGGVDIDVIRVIKSPRLSPSVLHTMSCTIAKPVNEASISRWSFVLTIFFAHTLLPQVSYLQNVARTLSNICSNEGHPLCFEAIQHVLPALACRLRHTDTQLAWTLVNFLSLSLQSLYQVCPCSICHSVNDQTYHLEVRHG